MATSTIKAIFDSDIRTVWNVVTSLEHYEWRSDLDSIEIVGDGRFVERTKDGFVTHFVVTAEEPLKRWEFDLENDNIAGHWAGIFSERDGQTEIIFTEEVEVKKRVLKPFVKLFLKRQQERYVADLRKALR